MAELTFVHAADLHLGRSFSGLERSSAELGTLFRRAQYEAWERVVAAAVEGKVDFVTLAGDVFDSSSPTVRARAAFKDGVERLHQAAVPVFLATGNHDPLSKFPNALRRLPGLHVFGPDPVGVEDAAVDLLQGVRIYGASYERSAVSENLARRFSRDPGVDVAIGVLHTNVAGTRGHKNYAPCSLDDLRAAGMDVWCLGHVHARSVLSSDPLIFYPGASQGAHMKETGPHGCYRVTVGEGNHVSAEFMPLAPVWWTPVDLDVTEVETVEDLVCAVEAACSDFSRSEAAPEAMVARLRIRGERRPDVTSALIPGSDFLEVMAERLLSLPVPVHLESVDETTRSPADLEALRQEDGFLADFLTLCVETGTDRHEMNRLANEARRELIRSVGQSNLADELAVGALKGDDGQVWTRLLGDAGALVSRMFVDPLP